MKIWARSAPPGGRFRPRSGGSWDRATEQQRADAELNARDATINAVTAPQPWTQPTVAARRHRSAGSWPHRRSPKYARSQIEPAVVAISPISILPLNDVI